MKLTVRHETDAAAIAAALNLVTEEYQRAGHTTGRYLDEANPAPRVFNVTILIRVADRRDPGFRIVSEFLAAVPAPAVYLWVMFAFLKHSTRQSARDPVVVGMSGVSSAGVAEDFLTGVMGRVNGVRKITRWDVDAEGYEGAIAAEVPDWEIHRSKWLSVLEQRMLSLQSQFAVVAARNALEDAGIRRIDLERTAVIVGSGAPAMEVVEDYITKEDRDAYFEVPKKLKKTIVSKFYIGTPAHMIAADIGISGPVETLANACTSVMSATHQAALRIASGECDVAIVGGCEAPINRTIVASMTAGKMHAKSDDPAHVMQPFSAGRTTSVLGEGAGVLVMMAHEEAKRQNLRIYGKLSGYSHRQETTRTPDKSGKNWGAAIRDAIGSKRTPDAVNSHGPSHDSIDLAECNALRIGLGAGRAETIPIFSIKPCIGSGMGAAGALQTIISLYSLYNDVLPPTRNYTGGDPDIRLNVVSDKPMRLPVQSILQNSRDIGGGVVSMYWEAGSKAHEFV